MPLILYGEFSLGSKNIVLKMVDFEGKWLFKGFLVQFFGGTITDEKGPYACQSLLIYVWGLLKQILEKMFFARAPLSSKKAFFNRKHGDPNPLFDYFLFKKRNKNDEGFWECNRAEWSSQWQVGRQVKRQRSGALARPIPPRTGMYVLLYWETCSS